ncbi:hypothetical protein COB52_05510 [Candidatus Kaiserbacteria bacterium]|nr:MAG: hypothetical protein COB52_05510 [Candidatus Kaiserbacteria bacterium]
MTDNAPPVNPTAMTNYQKIETDTFDVNQNAAGEFTDTDSSPTDSWVYYSRLFNGDPLPAWLRH